MVKFIERHPEFVPGDTTFIKRKWLNVSYAAGSRHQLDLYLPNEEKDSYPTVIDVYGGGLYFGEKSSDRMNGALELLKKGYAVVSPNYSLSYMADFPTPVYELKAVVRFVKANVAKFHLNPNQLIMMGQSSGAQLAMLVATSEASGKLQSDLGGNLEFSSQVNGVIASYGPYDLAMMRPQFEALNQKSNFPEVGEADSFEGMMLKNNCPRDVPELNAMVNPATYLNDKMVPTLFYAGTGDRVVPYVQTVNMAAKTIAAIGPEKVETHILPDLPHGESGFLNETIISQKDAFIKKVLG